MKDLTHDFGGIVPSRESILAFEEALRAKATEMDTLLRAEDFTKHYFAPGTYVRSLFIPKGCCLTGKIHREGHVNILAQGDISVLTEAGVRRFTAPCILVSSPGIKRIGYAHEDSMWITVHPNPDDEKDLEKLEVRYIAPSFEALGVDLKVLEDKT